VAWPPSAARRTHRPWSPRRWLHARRRGGAADANGEAAQTRRGLQGEHRGEEGQPSDKETRRGLTRNSSAPVERCGAAVFDGGGGTWSLAACSDESCRWRGKGWVRRGPVEEGKGGGCGAHREGGMAAAASVSRWWGRLWWSPVGSVRSCSAWHRDGGGVRTNQQEKRPVVVLTEEGDRRRCVYGFPTRRTTRVTSSVDR
jgi:hypothetical protein